LWSAVSIPATSTSDDAEEPQQGLWLGPPESLDHHQDGTELTDPPDRQYDVGSVDTSWITSDGDEENPAAARVGGYVPCSLR
jgi:hypothetical protein